MRLGVNKRGTNTERESQVSSVMRDKGKGEMETEQESERKERNREGQRARAREWGRMREGD